jgi:hypothetical protein
MSAFGGTGPLEPAIQIKSIGYLIFLPIFGFGKSWVRIEHFTPHDFPSLRHCAQSVDLIHSTHFYGIGGANKNKEMILCSPNRNFLLTLRPTK